MISFKQFLLEANATNTAFGAAYEIGTLLHLHDKTGSASNQNADYQNKIKALKKQHGASLSALSPEKRQKALDASHHSATTYLESLKQNHGVNPEDIEEVHHTAKGISSFIGREAPQEQNPHDVLVKTKDGRYHGASLKASKESTLTNNSVKTIDKGHIGTNIEKLWDDGKARAGLHGLPKPKVKELQDTPKVQAEYKRTQQKVIDHYMGQFNGAHPEDQFRHLESTMKAGKPEIPYDYVVGDKKYKSQPLEQMKHVMKIREVQKEYEESKKNGTVPFGGKKPFYAKRSSGKDGGTLVHIHAHDGTHLATVENRATHGAFVSPQVNTKIGSMKKV